jgi:hypothetical protein
MHHTITILDLLEVQYVHYIFIVYNVTGLGFRV